MRIAILGATSQIACDLVQSYAANSIHALVLYARRPLAVQDWIAKVNLTERYEVNGFEAFGTHEHFDAIINFVGVGNPSQAKAMGASIFDVTLKYDDMALDYVRQHPTCRYIFLSSGAAYGGNFGAPVDEKTCATVPINNLQPQDWYGVAKLHAECRHRALAHLPIVDIRVFNYFSHTQDMDARFLITDIVRAIRDKTVFNTSADFIVRDFIHPSDLSNLISLILFSAPANTAVDAYSKAPINKLTLLAALHEEFGLKYEIIHSFASYNATGGKLNYFSLNNQAKSFGYQPTFTSLQGVIYEAVRIVGSANF